MAGDNIPKFMCHYYNHYFAHTAGGRMIGRRMSEKLLDNYTLKFYQWEGGDVKVTEIFCSVFIFIYFLFFYFFIFYFYNSYFLFIFCFCTFLFPRSFVYSFVHLIGVDIDVCKQLAVIEFSPSSSKLKKNKKKHLQKKLCQKTQMKHFIFIWIN